MRVSHSALSCSERAKPAATASDIARTERGGDGREWEVDEERGAESERVKRDWTEGEEEVGGGGGQCVWRFGV